MTGTTDIAGTGDGALARRRSPLAGTAFGCDDPRLVMREDPFRSLVEVRAAEAPSAAAGAADPEHVWRIGPDWWLADGPPPSTPALEVPLAAALRAGGARCTDVSSHRTTLVLSGPDAATVLAHGCSLDLEVLPVGDAAQGVLAASPVVIGRTGAEDLRVYVRAAFAVHLAAWLTDAAGPYLRAG